MMMVRSAHWAHKNVKHTQTSESTSEMDGALFQFYLISVSKL